MAAARKRGEHRPALRGAIDWARAEFEREVFLLTTGFGGERARLTPEYRARFDVLSRWNGDDLAGAHAAYQALDPAWQVAPTAVERLAVAELLAHAGDPEAPAHLAALAREQPTEAAALRAVWSLRTGDRARALAAFEDAFARYRRDPWPLQPTMRRALHVARDFGAADPGAAAKIMRALARPFAVYVNDSERERTRFGIARALGPEHPACLQVFAEMEPHVPWTEAMLKFRAACYAAHGSELRERARADLARFAAAAPASMGELLR